MFPVRTKPKQAAKGSNGDRVANHNRVIAVLLDLATSLLRLLLDMLLFVAGLVFQRRSLLLGLLCLLPRLLLEPLALGLGLGLDILLLVVRRHR